ncbi:hypothetical protein JW766_03490 [Candidatus Dojkabacteria bacterium]|nr:hypothetical protein [Candidatus Dojkabacteria bacterium]
MKKNYTVALITCSVVIFLVVALVGAGFATYWFVFRIPSPAKAFKQASEEVKDMETVSFDINMEATYELAFDDELAIYNQEIRSEFEGEGVVDSKNERMRMELTVKMSGMSMKMIEVLDGDTLYIKTGSDDFVKIDINELDSSEYSDSAMTREDLTKQQVWSDLPSEVNYEYIEEDKIDDVKMYHYRVDISEENLEDFLGTFTESFVDSFNASAGGVLEISDDDIAIEGVSLEVWVNQKDASPSKEMVEIERITINLGEYGKMYIKDVFMEFVYKEVNGAVEIEIPEV